MRVHSFCAIFFSFFSFFYSRTNFVRQSDVPSDVSPPIFTRTNIKRPSCTIAPRAKLLIRIFDYIHSSSPPLEFPRSIEITDLRVKEGKKNRLSKSMREIWGENEVEKSRGARSLKFVHVSSRDQNIYVSPEIPDSIPGSTIVSIDVSQEMKLTVVAAILAKTDFPRGYRVLPCFDHLTNRIDGNTASSNFVSRST